MKTPAVLSLLTVAILWSCIDVSAQVRHRAHKDKVHGFRFTPPADWTEIPERAGEKWIVAKYIAPSAHFERQGNDGARARHRPMLRVMVFPHEVESVKVDRETHEDGTTVTRIEISNPYKNYVDYVKRHHKGGGFFFSEESETKIAGLEVSFKEITIEKLAVIPRRILAYIYHLKDRDLVIEVDVAEKALPKMRKRVVRSSRSLRQIEATEKREALPDDDRKLGPLTNDEFVDWTQKRVDWRKRFIRKLGDDLPKGWKKRERKGFLVLTRAGTKYTNHIVKLCGSMRRWLGKTFKDLGDREVMPSLVRICADGDEARAYVSGSGDSYSWDTGEVVVAAGNGIGILHDFSAIAQAMTMQHLNEKNPGLWRGLPAWLEDGLRAYASTAFPSKAKGLVFRSPTSDFREARQFLTDDCLVSVKKLLDTRADSDGSEGAADPAMKSRRVAARLFVRYLLEKGRKGKTKSLMKDWMTMSLKALEAMDREAWSELRKAHEEKHERPMTEEEEDNEFRERRKRAKEFAGALATKRQELLDAAFREVFGDWTEKDWEKIDKRFRSYVKSGR